jgi:hypothetical protein
VDQSSVTLKEFLQVRLDAQDHVSQQILDEVKATNGRVRTLEQKVAVLEERTPAVPATPKRDLTAGGVGAFVAGVGWFLWEKLHK